MHDAQILEDHPGHRETDSECILDNTIQEAELPDGDESIRVVELIGLLPKSGSWMGIHPEWEGK